MMALSAGTRLGPYEIVAPLGAGGMGEVYRGRDPRLGRDVAIKILPQSFASDPDRLRRFEQEARAVAALNHPNILAVHDFGSDGGVHYLVSELLDGEPLRAKLESGALSPRRATEYALQIANGLAAAHEKGIVHRDLKPENIFVTREGRVKILDFGLAKQSETLPGASAVSGDTMTSPPVLTAAGIVLGTVGYMAPEQVRGAVADHRSDIFAFGAILYEMLSGQRAFKAETGAETMTAILKQDPPEFTQSGARVSPALERIVRRCLEKEPEQRFQSAKDLAFALEALSGTSETGALRPVLPLKRKLRLQTAAAVVALAAIGLAVFFATRSEGPSKPILVRQLTFRDGYIRMARFGPDGQTVLYGAMWDGKPMQIFSGRIDSVDARAIDPPRADLLAVSSKGESLVSLDRHFLDSWVPEGTMARAPMLGGTPRPLVENVLDADWAPDGDLLAYTKREGDRFQLRLLPSGKVLYQNDGHISHIRFSPDGKRIAFMDHPIYSDDRGVLAVVDLEGNKKDLTPSYESEQGLAWSPDGREVWYTANAEEPFALRAVTLGGKQRVITNDVVQLELQDISRDGRVLLTSKINGGDVVAGTLGGAESKSLITYQWANARSLSADGQWAVLDEFNAPGPTLDYQIYLRKTDGSPATALGPGFALDISGDGKTVLAFLPSHNDKLVLVPTGVGETRTLPSFGLQYWYGGFLPDGKRAVLVAAEPGKGTRVYLQALDGKTPPRAITPEGTVQQNQAIVISGDGKWVIAMMRASESDAGGDTLMMYPVDGQGQAKPVRGALPGEIAAQWLQDGKVLVYRRGELPLTVYKLDPETGKREPWHKFVPSNPAGVLLFRSIYVTRDGKHYLYETRRVLSNLYAIQGLK